MSNPPRSLARACLSILPFVALTLVTAGCGDDSENETMVEVPAEVIKANQNSVEFAKKAQAAASDKSSSSSKKTAEKASAAKATDKEKK